MWGYWSDYPKVYRNGQDFAVIDGRLYSQHACERMVPSSMMAAGSRYIGRGVPPSYVEEAIRYGSSYLQDDGTTMYTNGSLKVVVNEFDAVVTVIC